MQKIKPLRVKMPEPGGAKLLIKDFSGNEEMGRPYLFELGLLSTTFSIPFDKVVGEEATVTMDLPEGGKRHFHGIINSFVQTGQEGSYAHFQATVVPKLWMLTRRATCRIFQKKDFPTVADVIFKVLDENGIKHEKHLVLTDYRPWEYIVQYRETMFNFISRLMEHEGIYYYFQHKDGEHTMVLCDSPGKHDPFPGYKSGPNLAVGEIPYGLGESSGNEESVSQWIKERQLQPENCVLGDFDFKNPKPVTADYDNVSDFTEAGSELYDYPGEYTDEQMASYKDHVNWGERYAQLQVEEIRAQREQYRGVGDARGIATGSKFKLLGSPWDPSEKAEYLVIAANYHVDAGGFESGMSADSTFSCDFSSIEATTQFRTPRTTPKPTVQGPETAIVVGEDEIDVDNYGRIHCQFHWDRYGASNAESSCRIRVSQFWAGPEWGSMHIPHKGQEVLVEFLGGNPDRPVVAGRLYNEKNMPPFSLPGNKTQSGWRDHGDNQMVVEGKDAEQFIHLQQKCANELLMDGKSGEESIHLQQKCDNKLIMNGKSGEESIHLKQKCGNELLMNGKSGEESVQLRDKFGNEIYMDAVGGTMRLSSPSHDSSIILGKSLFRKSNSNESSYTGGNTLNVNVGLKHDVYIGQRSQTDVGNYVEAMAGLKATFTGGSQYNLAVGNSYSWSYQKEVAVNNKDFVQHAMAAIKIDSETQVGIVGGAGDAARTRIGADGIHMSYKPQSESPRSEAGKAEAATAIAGLVSAAAAAAVGVTIGVNSAPTDDGPTKEAKSWSDVTSGVVAAGCGVAAGAALAAWGLASAANNSDIKDWSDSDATGKIVIDKKGVNISSTNKQTEIDMGAKSKKLRLYAKHELFLVSDYEIRIDAEEIKGRKNSLEFKNFKMDK